MVQAPYWPWILSSAWAWLLDLLLNILDGLLLVLLGHGDLDCDYETEKQPCCRALEDTEARSIVLL